jgi:hypothetical protein
MNPNVSEVSRNLSQSSQNDDYQSKIFQIHSSAILLSLDY